MSRDIAGDRRPIIDGKHLKAHRGTAAGIDQRAQDPGLQAMMVGIIVPFTHEHKSTLRQSLDQRGGVDEAGRFDIPDPPNEGMILAEARLPRFPGCAALPDSDEQGAEQKPCRGIPQCQGRFSKQLGASHWSRGIG